MTLFWLRAIRANFIGLSSVFRLAFALCFQHTSPCIPRCYTQLQHHNTCRAFPPPSARPYVPWSSPSLLPDPPFAFPSPCVVNRLACARQMLSDAKQSARANMRRNLCASVPTPVPDAAKKRRMVYAWRLPRRMLSARGAHAGANTKRMPERSPNTPGEG